jgi:hypothetical protein
MGRGEGPGRGGGLFCWLWAAGLEACLLGGWGLWGWTIPSASRLMVIVFCGRYV